MATTKRELLLICGIPATGKTCYANEFARQFRFVHHDLEEEETFNVFRSNPAHFIADIVGRHENAVVTWGFVPDNQPSVSAVLQFKASGFKLVWFDGNREAALKRFEDRARRKAKSLAEFYLRMHELYLQMHRIEATGIIETIKPVIINPLDATESFKSPAALLEEIRNA